MNFIRKIFEGQIDDAVRVQFQKFSKGCFSGKALIKVKCAKNGKCTVTTSYEFASEFVCLMARQLGEERAQITGVVISTADLDNELEFKDKKQFMGVKKYVIDKEMTGKEILGLCERFPKVFYGLSFSVGDAQLKIKAKAPKSGKPSNKGEKKPKADFCKLVTLDRAIAQDFVFEKSDFGEAEISHDFVIEGIELPEGESDPVKMRELAKRKGKIVRKGEIDGVVFEKEKEFVI